MKQGRIWEIDYLRVFAIGLMIVYHIAFELYAILGVEIAFDTGFWYWYAKLSAIFILVAGISAGFSKNLLHKGVKLLAVAVGISVVTYFALGRLYVRFGIIHFLGVCTLLYLPLRKLKVWILAILAAGIAMATPVIEQINIQSAVLLPLGIVYPEFETVDYFPLFPYLSVYMLGIIAYKLHYHKGRSLFNFSLHNRLIEKISRNSLLIYILHQPIIVGLLLLYKRLAG